MCGPKFCPMHNFRDVDWDRLAARGHMQAGGDGVIDDELIIAGRSFGSRLITGTGK